MAIDTIARGMAASNSGGGGGGINADIAKGVGIEFEGTDPITIKNSGVTSVSESSTNGTINVSNGGKTPVQVPVHGLGTAAYKNVDAFLASDIKYAGSDVKGGAANSAKKLTNTEAIGSETKAVYFDKNGIPVACTYEVNKDVPADAELTDTTYVVSTGTANGEIAITPSNADSYTVKVKGLNNAAYKDVADAIVESDENLVTSGLVYAGLDKKLDKNSVIDSVSNGNKNPVTSGAVYSALTNKADKDVFDSTKDGLVPQSTDVNAFLKGDGTWVTTENTTYTISEGSTNGTIKVVSSDEPNKEISVPVHGLGTAAYKNVDSSVTESSENLVTSGAVSQAISELPNPMLFKGSLGTGGTITSLPAASTDNEGYTYKVITAGTYSGQTAKIGDVFISNGKEWVIVPSGDEPNGTVTSVGMSVPTGLKIKSGTSPVTTSGTVEVQLDDGYVIPKSADIVPSTRKVNEKVLSSDIVLNGADIKTDGYTKATSASAIEATDTVNQAIGKLEYKADTNETNISNANTQIADIYNRCGGGKNLFKTPTNVSSVYRDLTFSWDSDGVLTVTGIPSYAGDIYIPQYPYITTGSQFTVPYDCIMYTLYSETHGDMWVSLHGYSADGQQFYKSSSALSLSAGDRIAGLYFKPTNTTTDYNFTVKFMIIPKSIGINAGTYVPYIPTNAELQSSFSILNDDISKRCWYSRIISDTAFDSSFSFKLSQNTIPDGKRIPVRIIFTTQYGMTPIEILFSVNSTNASPFTIAMLHGGIEPGSVLKVAIYSKTVADEKTTYYTVKILNKTQLYGMAYIEYPCVNDKLMFTVSYSSTQITETTEGARKINIYTPTYSLMS